MKLSASFEDGVIALLLVAETNAEQAMIGAILDQPQAQHGCGYLDKSLVSGALAYEGHYTNKRITSVKLSVFKPNAEKESA